MTDGWIIDKPNPPPPLYPIFFYKVGGIQILSTMMGKGGPALHCVNAKDDQDLSVRGHVLKGLFSTVVSHI